MKKNSDLLCQVNKFFGRVAVYFCKFASVFKMSKSIIIPTLQNMKGKG